MQRRFSRVHAVIAMQRNAITPGNLREQRRQSKFGKDQFTDIGRGNKGDNCDADYNANCFDNENGYSNDNNSNDDIVNSSYDSNDDNESSNNSNDNNDISNKKIK